MLWVYKIINSIIFIDFSQKKAILKKKKLSFQRPIPVRLAAGRAVLVYLRYNLKHVHRSEMRYKLNSELAHHSNFYNRMLYVRIMIEALDIYSTVYFKEFFFPSLISLTEDPVANIRLKIVTLLPTLKAQLKLPMDKKLITTLENSVKTLSSNEKDKDVLQALTAATEKMDLVEIQVENQVQSGDEDDLKKYKEEVKISASIQPIGKQAALANKRHSTKSRISGDLTSRARPTNISSPSKLSLVIYCNLLHLNCISPLIVHWKPFFLFIFFLDCNLQRKVKVWPLTKAIHK